MSFKSSGTYLRLSGDGKPPQSGGTQVFPVPPRATDNGSSGAPAGSCDTSAVSVRSTVGIGGAPDASAGQPPRPARRTPARDVNEPTRIFVISPSPSTPDAAAPSEEVSRRTATFASPPFAPVPAVVRARAPQAAGKSIPPAAAQPKADANLEAKTSAPPLLRAFDDVRARVSSWATASTITAPVAEVAAAVADAERRAARAHDGTLDAAELEPPRPALGVLSRLRQSSPATRKISLLLLAMTVVISGGSFVGRTIAKKRIAGSSVSAAKAAPSQPPATIKAGAAPLPPPAPPVEVAPAEEAPAEEAPADVTAAEVAAAEVAAAKPMPAVPARGALPATPDDRSPHSVTLARRAVDALLAGDRATALRHYRALSLEEPEQRAYREAARLLTSAPPDAPR
jgi:hypothetical protein